ncbi:MAG: DUF4019 domain-containing protein [Candidatus Omnitrophota bacterium]
MKKTLIFIAAILMLGGAGFANSEDGLETEAVKAADDWLRLLDQKEYRQCWKKSAAFLREQVSEEEWMKGMGSIDQIIGVTETRTLRTASYFRALPNAPIGEYVVIVYDVNYKNGQKAVETVTPMKDPDGQWRVSGYYIKPDR